MGKVEIEVFEDKLQGKSTLDCKLSFLLGAGRFAYFVADKDQQLLAFRAFRMLENKDSFYDQLDNFTDIIKEDELVSRPFFKVTVGLLSQDYTLIPDKLFTESEQASYIRNLLPVGEQELIQNDLIHELGVRLVYKYSSSVHSFFLKHFSKVKLVHAVTCLIKGFRKLHIVNPEQKVFVNFGNQVLHIIVFNHSELVFCNSYKFAAARDVIYFVLLVYKQFDFNPDEQKLLISGRIVKDSALYRLIYRYIRDCEFVGFPGNIRFSNNFIATIDEHAHFDLFQLGLCG